MCIALHRGSAFTLCADAAIPRASGPPDISRKFTQSSSRGFPFDMWRYSRSMSMTQTPRPQIKANLIAERVAIESYSQVIALIRETNSTK